MFIVSQLENTILTETVFLKYSTRLESYSSDSTLLTNMKSV